jgi:hypothetical protein
MLVLVFAVVTVIVIVKGKAYNDFEINSNISSVTNETNISTSNSTSIYDPKIEDDPRLLRFFFFGDWGKGGKSGTTMSSIDSLDDDHGNSQSTSSTTDSASITETEEEEFSIDSSDTASSILSNSITTTAGGGPGAGGAGGGGAGGGGAGGGGAGGGAGGGKQQQLHQVALAKTMAFYATNNTPAPSFLLSLGDNFYTNGVSSSEDVLWNYLWKDIYLQYSSLCIPWYAVLGNHDYGGGNSYSIAQVDRTHKHLDDDLWQMPAKNYSQLFEIPIPTNISSTNNNSYESIVQKYGMATVGILFVDTTTLAPSMNKCCNEEG